MGEIVQESAEKTLPRKMEKAARLLAEDRLTDVEIAAECGVSGRSLYKWKKKEEFVVRVNAMSQAYSARALGSGIASRVRRIETLNRLHDKMLAIMEERGEDPQMAFIPGGRTGLVVMDYVTIRTQSGKLGSVPTYAFDKALASEIRAVGEQTARELGQWMPEVQQVSEVKINVVYLTPDGKPNPDSVIQESAEKSLPRKMEKAARLLAEDLLTDLGIAAECGISDRSLYKWKKKEEFVARVNFMLQAYSARALGSGIASRVRRIETLKLLHDKMLTIMEERGSDLKMANIPGGRTGLMVMDYVTIRLQNGKIGTVPTYAFDKALASEIRAVVEQTSRELGQWMPEVQQVNEVKINVVYVTPDGKPVSEALPPAVVDVTPKPEVKPEANGAEAGDAGDAGEPEPGG